MRRLRALAGRLGPLGRYMVFSVIATGVDAGLGWFLHLGVHMPLAAANTAGMIAGFLVHYLLASKSVFRTEYGVAGFVIYLATFILGVVLGDILITLTDAWLRGLLGEPWRFLASKAVSTLTPFFLLYYLRQWLYSLLER